MFQRQIRELIPESRGEIATRSRRIIVDLTNVTHVDSTGLGALLRAWTAAQNQGCELEIANLNPRVEKLVEITRLDTVFRRARVVAAGTSAAAPLTVGEPLAALEPEEAYRRPFEAGIRFASMFGRGGSNHLPESAVRDMTVVEPRLAELG